MTSMRVVMTALLLLIVAPGSVFADRLKKGDFKRGNSDHSVMQACDETTVFKQPVVFRKQGNRISIPGAVSVAMDNWEVVYIPIDVETNWFKSTRETRKPVLLQMTAVPSTYLPFSDNDEYVSLMADRDARRDFIYGLEKARGREVETVTRLNHDGRDYVGTRFKSDPGGKILFTLGSIARNGLMVAFTFCFDKADDKAVTDLEDTSILASFLENVRFGPELRFQF